MSHHFISTAFPQRGKKKRTAFLPARTLSMLLSSILLEQSAQIIWTGFLGAPPPFNGRTVVFLTGARGTDGSRFYPPASVPPILPEPWPGLPALPAFWMWTWSPQSSYRETTKRGEREEWREWLTHSYGRWRSVHSHMMEHTQTHL